MFELSEEVVSQIIFSMENQNRAFLVRLSDGLVIPAERRGEEDGSRPGDRYEEPPRWESSDGYRLMERFVVTVQNPLVREQLREILASGRGVFRQFKNTLQEWPEIQRRWFTFKRLEMRSRIIAWYNTLREREGLPRLAVEEATEETGELLLTDFSIRRLATVAAGELEEFHRSAFFDAYRKLDSEVAQLLYARRRRALESFEAPGSVYFAAYDTGEELAGLLWAVSEGGERERGGELEQIELIYVVPDYRGLGIGEALTNYYLSDAEHRGVRMVLLEGPYHSGPVGRLLEQSDARELYRGSVIEFAGDPPSDGPEEEAQERDYPPDSYL